MPGRSPPQSAVHAEGLIKRAGTSALMRPYHPQAEEGDDKHRGHNFMGSRAVYDPCKKSSSLSLSIIFLSVTLLSRTALVAHK